MSSRIRVTLTHLSSSPRSEIPNKKRFGMTLDSMSSRHDSGRDLASEPDQQHVGVTYQPTCRPETFWFGTSFFDPERKLLGVTQLLSCSHGKNQVLA